MCPVERKSDAAEIERLLETLASADWLQGNKWWPKYVFHYTDVRNAVEILKCERLYCRAELDRRSGMVVDNASPSVIASTGGHVLDFVRLYFRPQTPTQFRNEGIRPRDQRELGGAHCPVPVFFLFDSADVLTRADSRFSEGNLAVAGTTLCSTAEELAAFDFRKIYHVGQFQRHMRDTIIHHRNAEVVVPSEMDLSSLKFVFCRSPAERETFLHLLPPEVFLKWNKKILVASKSQIYNCRWTFVETVELTQTQAVVSFSPDTTTPGPFDMTALITDVDTGREFAHRGRDFSAAKVLRIGVPKQVGRYHLRLTLDDDLAYANSFYGGEVPF